MTVRYGNEGNTHGGNEAQDGRRPSRGHKEGRGIVLRMPLEGGGRLVVEMTPDEVRALGQAIDDCEALKK